MTRPSAPAPAPATSDQAIADLLIHAHRSAQTVDAGAVQVADSAQAYRVQALVAQALGAFDRSRPGHWKSGGPTRSHVLTHAPLPPAGVWASPADARDWPFHWRGIEAEVALRLGQTVDPALAERLRPEEAESLIDGCAVAIEVVDSRWRQAREAPAWHRLCDLQSHGALVLGEWWAPRSVDWSRQTGEVRIGSHTIRFEGSHSLGGPYWLLPQWLRHLTRDGAEVPAGTVVTTGTWCGLPLAQKGDAVTVVFHGLGEATVQL